MSNKRIADYVEIYEYDLIIFPLFYQTLSNSTTKLNQSGFEMLHYLLADGYACGSPITMNNYIKDKVAKDFGKSSTSYNKITNLFKKLKILIPADKNSKRVFYMNPKFFWKESEDKRLALIEKLSKIDVLSKIDSF